MGTRGSVLRSVQQAEADAHYSMPLPEESKIVQLFEDWTLLHYGDGNVSANDFFNSGPAFSAVQNMRLNAGRYLFIQKRSAIGFEIDDLGMAVFHNVSYPRSEFEYKDGRTPP